MSRITWYKQNHLNYYNLIVTGWIFKKSFNRSARMGSADVRFFWMRKSQFEYLRKKRYLKNLTSNVRQLSCSF
jgi:hypothetical protein